MNCKVQIDVNNKLIFLRIGFQFIVANLLYLVCFCLNFLVLTALYINMEVKYKVFLLSEWNKK